MRRVMCWRDKVKEFNKKKEFVEPQIQPIGIELLREETRLRQLRITLPNGTIVKAEKTIFMAPNEVEWWSGNTRALTPEEDTIAEPIVRRHSEWLRGGPRPDESTTK